jgi:elongation factor Ts
MAVTIDMIKELRGATGVGIADCRKALQETDGNFDEAVKILRERGAAVAAKRAEKDAKEGIISARVVDNGKKGALVEVNCETDFVSRNDAFQNAVEDLAKDALNHETDTMAEAVADRINDLIAAIGENIKLRRNTKWEVEGTGTIVSYIHMGGKVGVLLELACEKEETLSSPIFQELAKDLTLHIAAAAPQHLNRDEVSAETIESEKEIFRKQLEGKPENIIDNILKGKINKFFSQICFLEQGFVKEDKTPVNELIAQKSKELDDTITVKRFVRYQLGV